MRTRRIDTIILLFIMVALLSSALFFSRVSSAATTSNVITQTEKAQVQELYGHLPLHFIANQGQAPSQVKFYHKGGPGTFSFTPEGIYLKLPQGKGTLEAAAMVRLTPLGMRRDVELTGGGLLSGKVHYFLGNNPKQWRTNLPTYQTVLYREAYPGIDLKFYGTGRQLEYDIIVKPGADPHQVRFQYSGIEKLRLTKAGDLVITLPGGGELVQKKPLAYQEIDGQRLDRDSCFKVARVNGQWRYGFQVASYDQTHPLIIDPVLVYSTFLGGTSHDAGNAVAVDKAGNVYVTGYTQSADFPSLPVSALLGPEDVFVTKINASGTGLVFSLFLGGDSTDGGTGIAVDSANNIWVTGYTQSSNFPLQDAYQGTYGGFRDAFVTKIQADGAALLYSTYLGGSSYDMARGIALDNAGNAHITGETTSSDFPRTTGDTYKGEQDGFVAKFSPGQGDKGLAYSIYLGGEGSKTGYGIALDKDNKTYVAGGITISGPEPFEFSNQAFVTKLSDLSNNPVVVYTKTLAGGTAYGVAVDGNGCAYVTGGTSSASFPTQTPIFPYQAGMDAFVSKLNQAGSDLVYSTFLPGQLNERGNAIAVDTTGSAYVTGFTDSGDFRIKNGTPWKNFDDIFVTRINPAGTALVYSTCIGGLSSEWGNGVALDVAGNAYVTGYTGSTDFPLKNPLYSQYKGAVDAVVLKLKSSDAGPAIDLLLLAD